MKTLLQKFKNKNVLFGGYSILAIIVCAIYIIFFNNSAITNTTLESELLWFNNIVIATLTIITIVFSYFILFKEIKKEVFFSLSVFVLGLCYLVTLTPFSAPDEEHHYQTTYELSNILLFNLDDKELGDAQYFDYTDFELHSNIKSGYVRVFDEFGGKIESGEQIEIPTPRDLAYFVQYLPSAIGVSIGRLFNFNLVTIFMLGRLFNLSFYAGCVFLAIKRLPKFKTVLGLSALIPMAIHQASSFSYDSFINGLSFLLIASILRLIFINTKAELSDILFIAISGVLLAPAKVVYFVILFLLFIVDKEQFGGKKKKLLIISGIILACLIVVGIFQLPNILEMGTSNETNHNLYKESSYTLSYVLQHPINSIIIIMKTIIMRTSGWVLQAIGINMSGLTIPISPYIIYTYIALILLSIRSKGNENTSIRRIYRVFALLIAFGVVALVVVSMFLSWTSTKLTIVEGVQGRYFIPVIPLIAIALSGDTILIKKDIDKYLSISAIILNVLSISQILNFTLIG